MLAKDPDLALRMADNLRRMIDTVGLRTSLAKARLEEINDLIEHGKLRGQPRLMERETRDRPTSRHGSEHASTRTKHH
jgi:hypothetical protein